MGVASSVDLTPTQRKTILNLLKRHLPNTTVWAYGSRVRWTSTPKSDLDMVAFTEPEQKMSVANLKEAFEESDLPFRVDFFTWDEVPEQFHKNIEVEHMVLQEQEQYVGSKWQTKPLGEILELIIDHRGKTPRKLGFADFFDSGYPVLSAKHVKTDELVNLDNLRFASPEMYKKWMKVETQEGDIILTSEAPMGEVFYVDGKTQYVLGQRVFGLRADKSQVNPKYLAAWLSSQKGQNELLKRASGSTVIGIKQSELVQIEVDIPPMGIQDRIASIRFSIIDKIHLNRQINQTLEAMAQVIFKSWFVDFDPVRAKIAALEGGEEPTRAAMRAISGKTDVELEQMPQEQHSQLQSIAELFPSAMIESEFGEVPEGWEPTKVSDFIELAYGKALKKTVRVPGNVPVYGSGGINGTHNVALVNGPGIIVGRKGTVGSLYWEDKDFFPIDTVFYVKPIKDATLEFSYYMLQTLGLENMNTDAAVPGLNRENVYRLEIPNPGREMIRCFSEFVEALRRKIESNSLETELLTESRETLLPKLLSGEIRVSEVEKVLTKV